jgi:hypothetical protein
MTKIISYRDSSRRMRRRRRRKMTSCSSYRSRKRGQSSQLIS